MKKAISLFVVLLVLFSCFTSAYAASTTTDTIDSMNSLVVQMYDASESAPQQTSAAALGSMYMLNIILNEISSNQARRDAISEIVSTITDEVGKAEGAPQVSALSLYGCVYVLSAIAYEKDILGTYSELIDSVLDNLSNANPSSAVQEMAVASYRMVDLLEIIAFEEGVSSTIITAIEELLLENDKTVSGAPQQTANGLYRAAELISYIAKEDCSRTVASKISGLLDSMYEDNDRCESAVQQTTNGMSTVYLMLYAIAQDKA